MSGTTEIDPSRTRAALDQVTHAPGAIFASPEILRREVAGQQGEAPSGDHALMAARAGGLGSSLQGRLSSALQGGKP